MPKSLAELRSAEQATKNDDLSHGASRLSGGCVDLFAPFFNIDQEHCQVLAEP
jgi:hypothetical protein